MNTLPTKSDPAGQTEVEEIPTWHDLGERLRDVMKDIAAEIARAWKKEGKELETEVQARVLPALKRARLELDKLVTPLEERTQKRQQ